MKTANCSQNRKRSLFFNFSYNFLYLLHMPSIMVWTTFISIIFNCLLILFTNYFAFVNAQSCLPTIGQASVDQKSSIGRLRNIRWIHMLQHKRYIVLIEPICCCICIMGHSRTLALPLV